MPWWASFILVVLAMVILDQGWANLLNHRHRRAVLRSLSRGGEVSVHLHRDRRADHLRGADREADLHEALWEWYVARGEARHGGAEERAWLARTEHRLAQFALAPMRPN